MKCIWQAVLHLALYDVIPGGIGLPFCDELVKNRGDLWTGYLYTMNKDKEAFIHADEQDI